MKYLCILIILLSCYSCNWAKRKTKETINKSGEIVAKTGSEFIDGVSKGIEKTFQNKIEISEQLQKYGIETGRIVISGTNNSPDHILSVYLIFNENFDYPITAKVLDENGLEYGRTKNKVNGSIGEAHYFDFVFDKRTNIDGRGKLILE